MHLWFALNFRPFKCIAFSHQFGTWAVQTTEGPVHVRAQEPFEHDFRPSNTLSGTWIFLLIQQANFLRCLVTYTSIEVRKRRISDSAVGLGHHPSHHYKKVDSDGTGHIMYETWRLIRTGRVFVKLWGRDSFPLPSLDHDVSLIHRTRTWLYGGG